MAFAQPVTLPTRVARKRPPPSRTTPSCTASPKPRRVGIAGAGIAGLSTALALLRTPATGVEHVHIFEPRPLWHAARGAALNLNGASAILRSAYHIPVHHIATPIDTVIAREVTGTTLFRVDVHRAVNASNAAAKQLSINGRHSFMTVMRHDLHSLLTDQIRHHVTFHTGESYRVAAVHHQQHAVHFVMHDGTFSQPFDLVVGADGVRSAVRTHVTMHPAKPTYTGIRIQWAVARASTLPKRHVEQWFGDGVYVLRYAAGPQAQQHEIIAASFRQPLRAAENDSYRPDQSLRNDFLARLQRASMPPAVTDVLQRSERLIETPVYRQPLPRAWHRGPCCLVGDSAHAMPPYLGQGANQAVQDAHCLALSISQIGSRYNTLSEALQGYEQVRRAPVQAILQTSRLVSFLEIQDGSVQSRVRNNFFRVLGLAGIPARTLVQAAIPRVS